MSNSFSVFASDSISDVSFNRPYGLAFDTSGNLYCTNLYDNNILKIDTDGSGTIFASGSIFNGPSGLVFDTSGNLYCVNYFGNNILKFDTDGSGTIFASDSISNVSFIYPTGLAFDSSGYLYCGTGENSILRFDTDGSGIIFASNSISDNYFNTPAYLAFDSSDYLYVSNYDGDNIVKSTQIVCFNENTKILCFNDLEQEEEYIPIQYLKKGSIVKTYKQGYRKIEFILQGEFYNNPIDWRNTMYKMEKTDENGLLEDLIITGGHSILVDNISKIEQERYNKLGISNFGKENKIEDKYFVLAAVSEQFIKILDNNKYSYYHFCVENDGDDTERFGVWANGILTEIPSKDFLLQQKKY